MKLYDDKNFIGNVIKTARKNASLNQAQLAERLDMTDKNLGNIENGKQFPQLNNFFRILEELNLSVEDFSVKSTGKEKTLRTNLLKDIYLADERELNVYSEILNAINKLARKS